MDEIKIETAIKLLDEYFYEDDRLCPEQIIKRAYEVLKRSVKEKEEG